MKRPVQHHPFADSGYRTAGVKPEPICGNCWMPESDQRHRLPETTPEATALDAAKLGETKEHQPT